MEREQERKKTMEPEGHSVKEDEGGNETIREQVSGGDSEREQWAGRPYKCILHLFLSTASWELLEEASNTKPSKQNNCPFPSVLPGLALALAKRCRWLQVTSASPGRSLLFQSGCLKPSPSREEQDCTENHKQKGTNNVTLQQISERI